MSDTTEGGVSRGGQLGNETLLGLTNERVKNTELMEDLEKKYPDAFVEVVDSKGRKALVAGNYDMGNKSYKHGSRDMSAIITQEGVFMAKVEILGPNEEAENMVDWIKSNDWDRFNEQLREKKELLQSHGRSTDGVTLIFNNPSIDYKLIGISISGTLVNPDSVGQMMELRTVLRSSQNFGEIKRKNEENRQM